MTFVHVNAVKYQHFRKENCIASFVFLQMNSLRVNNIDYVLVQALKNFGQQLYECNINNQVLIVIGLFITKIMKKFYF